MKASILAGALVLIGQTGLHAQEDGAATATFSNTQGETIGEAKLTAVPSGVLIELDLDGLTPESWVSFHIHETGECDPSADFETAGGHFNPTSADHGLLVEGGPHAGDMPNQYVGSGGTLKSAVFNSMANLEGDAGITGKSLVIHGGQDDYKTQPSGDAGSRIACAVIE